MEAHTRRALLIEFDQLSRDRNGMNPKTSTYAKITEKMVAIKKRLGEEADPDGFAKDMRDRRNRSRRRRVLQKQAREQREQRRDERWKTNPRAQMV